MPTEAIIDVERAVVLYGKGYTTVQIGEFFGVTPTSVRAQLIKAGVTMRSRNVRPLKRLPALASNSRRPWTPEDDKALAQRAEWGFTYAEIGRQLGRSMQSCKVRAHKLGAVDKTGQRRQDRLAETRGRKKGAAELRRIAAASRKRAREAGKQEDFGKRMHDPQTRALAVAALRRRLRGYDVPPEREDEYRYYKKVKKMTVAEIKSIMRL